MTYAIYCVISSAAEKSVTFLNPNIYYRTFFVSALNAFPYRDPAKSEILRERGATPLKMKIKACFNLSKNAVVATTFVHFIHKKNTFLVIIFSPILLTFKYGCDRMILK